MKLKIFKPCNKNNIDLPLFLTSVQAGFPSPAEGDIEETLNLNELLIDHPAATFFVRVEGSSMIDAQIHSGDVVIVDRSLTPADGQIVVAVLNGEFTLKRIRKKGARFYLVPENPDFPPIEVTSDMDFEVWGVVTYIIHKAR